MIRTVLPALVTFSLLLAVPAPAAVPYTFSAGTPARAASVNANFTALDSGLPGLANHYYNSTFTAASTSAMVTSLTVVCSSAGYLFVIAQASQHINHITGTISFLDSCLNTIKNTFENAHQSPFQLDSGIPTGTYASSMFVTRTFSIGAAGNFKVYLNSYFDGNVSSHGYIYRCNMTGIFIPLAAGTVDITGGIEPLGDRPAVPSPAP
jgi:hypothetical protein